MLRTIKLLVMSLIVVATNATASQDAFKNIIEAYNVMLVGRTLESDEGARLRFTGSRVTSDGRYMVTYDISFASGARSSGVEAVQISQPSVFVDQIAEGVTMRRNLASIEEPYHVFRIRPAVPETTDFITRDCIRKNAQEGTTCYIKVRYLNDVIVSRFHELKSASTP